VSTSLSTIEWRRLVPTDRRLGLAWVCVASFVLPSERYPAIATVSSAQIRVQDVLFIALIAMSARMLVEWAATHRLVAVAIGIFSALVAVAALHSPVGGPAVVAAGKYLEYLLAGASVGINIRRAQDPSPFTWAICAATVLNLAIAVVETFWDGGLSGPLTIRSGGRLGLESAATLGCVTVVWCLARLSRAGRYERTCAIVGASAGVVLLLLAKSVLALAALVAIAAVAPSVQSRAALRLAVVAIVAVLVLIVGVGRISDVRSAGGEVPVSTNVDIRTLAIPSTGDPPKVPGAFPLTQPPRVTGGSFVHRIALGYLGARIALDAPFLGHGWLTVSNPDFLRDGPYDRYMLDRFGDLEPALFVSNFPEGPHNAYIQILAEAGWPAVIAFVLALVVSLTAGLVAPRRVGRESWLTSVGAAWLALLVIFLGSSALFGGQLESSMLGAGLVLSAPSTGLGVVRPRVWIAAGTTLALLVGIAAAGLFLPASKKDGDPVARVRALTGSGAGSEVFARGPVDPSSDLVLDNGLLQARLSDTSVRLSEAADGGEIDLPVVAPGTVAGERITRRQADAISVAAHDREGRSLFGVTVRRGIPGAFIQLPPGRTLALPRPAIALHDPNLRTSTFPLRSDPAGFASAGETILDLAGASHRALVVVPAAPRRLRADAGGFPAGTQTLFVSTVPRVGPPSPAALPHGAYLVVPRGARGRTAIQREDSLRGTTSGVAVPFMLEDNTRSGLARLVSLARQYGARDTDDG
jgi:O-antigen ligase/polysaccharide polymerase Wzy-like membrane protein